MVQDEENEQGFGLIGHIVEKLFKFYWSGLFDWSSLCLIFEQHPLLLIGWSDFLETKHIQLSLVKFYKRQRKIESIQAGQQNKKLYTSL